jgi:hypothetical protein
MKTIRTLFAALPLIGILGFTGGPAIAYEVHYIRLTGILIPLEEEGRKTDTVNIVMNGTEWVFKIAKAENLAQTGVDGRTALRHVFPARLLLTGSKELIKNLQNPESVGKPVAITGFLYAASRILFVTAVDETKRG